MRRSTFQLVFFHARGDWLKRQLPDRAAPVVSGKVELFDGVAQMVHPDHILRWRRRATSRPSSRSIR
jgi:ATP-dependent DNA helicase RecG